MSRKTRWLDCWVPHRLEMLKHPSWRLAPIPLRRAIERFEIEHLGHGGQKNGHLFVSYGQLEQTGISRRSIAAVLELGWQLGLVETIRPNDPLGDIRSPNAYRLTYVPAKGKGAPTDEWRRLKPEEASAFIEKFREKERAREAAKTVKRKAA